MSLRKYLVPVLALFWQGSFYEHTEAAVYDDEGAVKRTETASLSTLCLYEDGAHAEFQTRESVNGRPTVDGSVEYVVAWRSPADDGAPKPAAPAQALRAVKPEDREDVVISA
jgi:hypothetical protein